ncbi:MAG: hypothetical protein NT146_03770 [Mycobacterium sp.]|nr:hypothetical protein [Mycobacterium sp.]
MADEPTGSETPEPAATPTPAATPAAPATPATPAVSAADTMATPLPPVPAPILDTPILDTRILDTGYTEAGVPTLDGVREKIEARYGTALGATELAEETPEVRAAADQYEARNKAAAEKLEEIRASMHKPD